MITASIRCAALKSLVKILVIPEYYINLINVVKVVEMYFIDFTFFTIKNLSGLWKTSAVFHSWMHVVGRHILNEQDTNS